MIYIFTALYCEAHIFIQKYNLIKNQEITWFQEFYNKTTGTGLQELSHTQSKIMEYFCLTRL